MYDQHSPDADIQTDTSQTEISIFITIAKVRSVYSTQDCLVRFFVVPTPLNSCPLLRVILWGRGTCEFGARCVGVWTVRFCLYSSLAVSPIDMAHVQLRCGVHTVDTQHLRSRPYGCIRTLQHLPMLDLAHDSTGYGETDNELPSLHPK